MSENSTSTSTASQTAQNASTNSESVPRGTNTPQQEVAQRNQQSVSSDKNKQSSQKTDNIAQAVENMSQEQLEEFFDLDKFADKKIRRKINGKEEVFTLKDIVEGFQTRKASDERFREASMKEKKSEELVRLLRTDPIKVLGHKALGHNVRELAEKYLIEQLQEEMMDPKDKKIRDYEREIEENKRKEKEKIEAEENERLLQLKEHYTNQFSTDIVSALQESGLPKTEHTVKRMAYYMHQALQRGYDLSAKDVVEFVRKDYVDEQKSLFGAMDGDVLLQLLGEETLSKIRKSDVQRLKAKGFGGKTPNKQPQVFKKQSTDRKLTKDQWRENLLKKRT